MGVARPRAHGHETTWRYQKSYSMKKDKDLSVSQIATMGEIFEIKGLK